GQVGAGSLAGYGPHRGDGRDQHVPSGLGHSGAGAPVVDIAARGTAGIVEPLGNYDMHPFDVSGPPERLPLVKRSRDNLQPQTEGRFEVVLPWTAIAQTWLP